jgi:hypothetical protein
LFSNSVTNLPSIARAQKQNTFSQTESKLSSEGKKVASIFGVDKISVEKKNGKWFFYFVDTACMAQANPENPNGTEYFYYTPSLPQLAVAQAHKMVEWFERNPKKEYLTLPGNERALLDSAYTSWTYDKHYREYHEVNEITKLVCYPYWDFNRFQADKPFAQLDNLPLGVRAWDNILTVLPDFQRIQQHWEYYWKSYLQKIDLRFMKRGNSKDTVMVFKSKMHPIINTLCLK